jgi:chloride channel protein, CIC family
MHLISKIWKEKFLKYLLKNEINEERTYFALTLIVGVLAGVTAVSLQKIIHFTIDELGTLKPFTLETFLWGFGAIFISGYLTTRKFPSTSGSGIPGVRVALAVYHGKITYQATIAKFITSAMSLSFGMSLGREGPTAAITSGIGSYLGQVFHLSKKKVKALVAIGAAGGIAAAFNTPIAAVVFTLEEIVGDLNAKILGNIIISSVVAAVTAQILTGNTSMFTELNYQLEHPSEIFIYIFIGLTTALMGPLWMNSVLSWRKINLKLFRGHRLTIIMVSFTIIAGLSHIRPEVLGSGHETIEEALLSLILDWKTLVSLFALKFLATTLSYGSGISGGLFMPTLLMGAMIGSIVGSMAQFFLPNFDISIGAYALVGMGAFFASVIRAPFTSIIMVFELTRDYNIILPLMIANIVSYILSGKIQPGSIYENISEQDGIHLPGREDNEILETLIVEDTMVINPVTINYRFTVEEAFEFIKDKSFSGYPVLAEGHLMGMVSTNDIKSNYATGDKCRPLMEIAEKKIISIYPDQSLLVALHKLKRFGVSRLPVVSRINDRDITGIITAENIVSKFGYHILEDDTDEKTDPKKEK